jgi:uncharacterized membrane protein
MSNKLLTIILFIVIDFIWLKTSYPMYNKLIKNIQGSSIKLRYIPAMISYILIILGYFLYVEPRMNTINKKDLLKYSFLYGGVFGIIVYGIYDFTNLATIKNWSLFVSIIDMLWGGILFTIVTYISNYF